MKTIIINGHKVRIELATFRRIEKVAEKKKITFSDAVFLCLEKVL